MNKLDVLEREKFVNQLITVVENISDSKKSISFAIDGTWGCGKSFVLDLFEEKLNELYPEGTLEEKYFVIRYNCWEYDYYEEPLVAIVAVMLDAIDQKTKIIESEKREKIKGVLKAVGATLLSVANDGIKSTMGVDLEEAFQIVKSGMESGKREYEKANEYDKYFGFKKALESLQSVLGQLNEQYTVVFLIDELDRCLPEYAIKVIERLHHLIERTKNIIHIISTDKVQLEKSIQGIFGSINADEYLKKFIRFTLTLDKGSVSEKFVEKHADYIDLFDKNIVKYEDSIEEFLKQVFRDIDVREQERLIERITLAHTMLFNEKKECGFMCIEILAAVVFSRDYKINFCNWLDQFLGIDGSSKKDAPFAEFFRIKFEKLPCQGKENNINFVPSELYILLNPNTIYSAIAYMWIRLMAEENDINRFINIYDNNIRTIWDSNLGELEKFVEMIKIIK